MGFKRNEQALPKTPGLPDSVIGFLQSCTTRFTLPRADQNRSTAIATSRSAGLVALTVSTRPIPQT